MLTNSEVHFVINVIKINFNFTLRIHSETQSLYDIGMHKCLMHHYWAWRIPWFKKWSHRSQCLNKSTVHARVRTAIVVGFDFEVRMKRIYGAPRKWCFIAWPTPPSSPFHPIVRKQFSFLAPIRWELKVKPHKLLWLWILSPQGFEGFAWTNHWFL